MLKSSNVTRSALTCSLAAPFDVSNNSSSSRAGSHSSKISVQLCSDRHSIPGLTIRRWPHSCRPFIQAIEAAGEDAGVSSRAPGGSRTAALLPARLHQYRRAQTAGEHSSRVYLATSSFAELERRSVRAQNLLGDEASPAVFLEEISQETLRAASPWLGAIGKYAVRNAAWR